MADNSNKKAFENGINIFYSLLYDRLYNAFIEVGRDLLKHAKDNAGYRNLTGNTITSISFGLYKKGQISDIVFLEGIRPPIRRKLKKGEWFRGIDYDGNNRAFRGQVETDGNWAKNTSANFLMSFVPTYPYSIVVCTGTEYSEYIEEGDLNVMTETSLYAKVKSLMLFKSNFKKI